MVALRLEAGDVAPAGSTVVIFDAAGHARRAVPGKVAHGQDETVFCFHPGPYTMDLIPFAAAPEWALRLRFVVDAANPRVPQQRFDLYLFSETSGSLPLAGFAASVEAALQAELALGALDLPPCTSIEEWHAFRAGLNQLMYTRYGVTVDDCVPVDLGDQIDFADVLKARAAVAAQADVREEAREEAQRLAAGAPAAAPVEPSTSAAASPVQGALQAADAPLLVSSPAATPASPPPARPADRAAAPPAKSESPAQRDSRALRRLFLELPAVSRELRLLPLPHGLPIFERHQALLLRLNMASLNVNTMPALAWAAPDQPLTDEHQRRRSRQTLIARDALDEAWSLLARLQLAGDDQWPLLLEEADRVCANLETGLSLRRTPHVERMEPSL